MPPLFASKSPFFVPDRQKFSHPVHGLPHFPDSSVLPMFPLF